RPTIAALLNSVVPKVETKFFDKLAAGRREWDAMLDKQCYPTRSEKIHPQAVARAASDLADPNAVFVIDTGLNTLWSGNWIRQNGTQRIIGSFNNAAVGTALGQANGIQALDRSIEQILLAKRLGQKLNRASLHRLPRHGYVA